MRLRAYAPIRLNLLGDGKAAMSSHLSGRPHERLEIEHLQTPGQAKEPLTTTHSPLALQVTKELQRHEQAAKAI